MTRTLNCPASVHLPKTPRASGPAAEWGTAIHSVKEGRDPGRADARAWAALHEPFWPRTVLWPEGHHERGLGLRVAVKGYPRRHHAVTQAWEGPAEKRWDLSDDWATGACDWYTLDGPVVWLDDLKTGGNPELPPTDQLTFYATALARHLDTKTDVLTSITHWPRYPKGRGPVRSTALVTYDDRRDFEARLARAKALADTNPEPTPGYWCLYCECTTCPYNGK